MTPRWLQPPRPSSAPIEFRRESRSRTGWRGSAIGCGARRQRARDGYRAAWLMRAMIALIPRGDGPGQRDAWRGPVGGDCGCRPGGLSRCGRRALAHILWQLGVSAPRRIIGLILDIVMISGFAAVFGLAGGFLSAVCLARPGQRLSLRPVLSPGSDAAGKCRACTALAATSSWISLAGAGDRAAGWHDLAAAWCGDVDGAACSPQSAGGSSGSHRDGCASAQRYCCGPR